MARNVLLARPHPFVVTQMQLLVSKAGMVPYRLHSSSGQEQKGYEPLCGAVISAAVAAESPLSLVEAWGWVRDRYPALPVVFSALAGYHVIVPKLRRELSLPAEVEIAGMQTDVKTHAAVGTDKLLLFVTDTDLATQPGKVIEAFVAHFKPA